MQPNSETADLLGTFGVKMASGSLQIPDFDKAHKAYIHHSCEPVAAVAYTLFSPSFCKIKLPNYQLVDLIRKCGCLDSKEIVAFAELCGTHTTPHYRSTSDFCAHLHVVIDRYDLRTFFLTGQTPIQGIDVLPAGIDWKHPDHGPLGMDEWRRAYKTLPAAKKMLVASIIWLYRGYQNDLKWMNRLPRRWHAADAIVDLKKANMLADWGRLFALYAGW
jgi:hypothetical protein